MQPSKEHLSRAKLTIGKYGGHCYHTEMEEGSYRISRCCQCPKTLKELVAV